METGNEALEVLCIIYPLDDLFQTAGMLGPETGILQGGYDQAITQEKLLIKRRCSKVSLALRSGRVSP